MADTASENKGPHPLSTYRKFCRCLQEIMVAEEQEGVMLSEVTTHAGCISVEPPKATPSRPHGKINTHGKPRAWTPPMQTAQKVVTCPYSYKLNDTKSNLKTKPPTLCSQGWGVSQCERFDPSCNPNYCIRFQLTTVFIIMIMQWLH